MPQFIVNLDAAQQYLGTVGTGLFIPGNTGSPTIQIILDSIRFNTTSAVSFAFYEVDPGNAANKTLLFGDNGIDLSDDSGRRMNVNDDGVSWNFSFETDVLGADAFLTVGYRFVGIS